MKSSSVILSLALVTTALAQSAVPSCIENCSAFAALGNKCSGVLTSDDMTALEACFCNNISSLNGCCVGDTNGQTYLSTLSDYCKSNSGVPGNSTTATAVSSPTPSSSSRVVSFSSSPSSRSTFATSVQPNDAASSATGAASTSQPPASSTPLSGGAIAGIAIGGAAAGALVIGAFAFFCFRRLRRNPAPAPAPAALQQQPPGPPMQPYYGTHPGMVTVMPAPHAGPPLNPQNLDTHLASQEWAGIQQVVPQKQTAYLNTVEIQPEPHMSGQMSGQHSHGISNSVTLNNAPELTPEDAVGESRYGASQVGGSQVGGSQVASMPPATQRYGNGAGLGVPGQGAPSQIYSEVPLTARYPASESVWHQRA